MRNKWKCKKCQYNIEPQYNTYWTYCSCGEIGVMGTLENGKQFCRNIDSFIDLDKESEENKAKEDRLDDDGKGIDHYEECLALISYFEREPEHEKERPCNKYDLLSILYLMASSLKPKP